VRLSWLLLGPGLMAWLRRQLGIRSIVSTSNRAPALRRAAVTASAGRGRIDPLVGMVMRKAGSGHGFGRCCRAGVLPSARWFVGRCCLLGFVGPGLLDGRVSLLRGEPGLGAGGRRLAIEAKPPAVQRRGCRCNRP